MAFQTKRFWTFWATTIMPFQKSEKSTNSKTPDLSVLESVTVIEICTFDRQSSLYGKHLLKNSKNFWQIFTNFFEKRDEKFQSNITIPWMRCMISLENLILLVSPKTTYTTVVTTWYNISLFWFLCTKLEFFSFSRYCRFMRIFMNIKQSDTKP